MTDRELLELLVKKFDNFEKDMQEVKQDMQNLKQKVDRNTAMLEGEFDKMVDLLGEGYQMTREKIKNADIDSMKDKINHLELLCKFNQEEISVLRKKIS